MHGDRDRIVLGSHLAISRQWLLAEHRLKEGTAVMPGTAYMEMASAAYASNRPRGPIELQDVFFLAPLSVTEANAKELRVQLRREEDGHVTRDAFRFSVFAQPTGSESNGAWLEHSAGRIERLSIKAQTKISRQAIEARCLARQIVFDSTHRTRQERYFNFGPRWQCMRRLRVGDHEGLGELEIDPRFATECATFRLHPAMLDLATGCSLYLIEGYESLDDLYLPISYKRLRSYRSLPAKFFSHMRSRPENKPRGDVATFDLTLFNEEGEVLAEIDGFAMRRISDLSTVTEVGGTPSAPTAVYSDPPARVLPSGITPLEGVEMLVQILQTDTPTSLLVTDRKTEDLIDDETSTQQLVTSAPAADKRDVEATVQGWFQDLLGMEAVNLDDDFFALGGHSLVGVRLFAKIKNTYHVDLELGSLFEFRTVAETGCDDCSE
jgi:acyl carrier protein